MAQSSKPQKGKKKTPAEAKKLADAIALIKASYADVLSVWGQVTDKQKQDYLANSPLLAELLDWSEQWRQ